jgi:BirA family biotin operon repressor/biotin-[acetyl-CoA-carboxylase] ligase
MIGQKIMHFDRVNSTNDFLKQNKENLDHGTVVLSTVQTKGRGRKGQSWISEKGNLYASFLLSENIAYKDLSRVMFQTSLAIVKVLEQFDIQALIKYPNDIIVKGKKIAGILIETSGMSTLEFVSVGIGLNVLQKNIPGLEDKAISISEVTTKDLDVKDILQRIIDMYNDLEEETMSYIYGCYIKYSMVIGHSIQIDGHEANIIDITRSGHLVVFIDGEEKIYEDKEISLEELYKSTQK